MKIPHPRYYCFVKENTMVNNLKLELSSEQIGFYLGRYLFTALLWNNRQLGEFITCDLSCTQQVEDYGRELRVD